MLQHKAEYNNMFKESKKKLKIKRKLKFLFIKISKKTISVSFDIYP